LISRPEIDRLAFDGRRSTVNRFSLRSLFVLPVLVACLFAVSQAIRHWGADLLGRDLVNLHAVVTAVLVAAGFSAAAWSTLGRQAVLLRTGIAAVLGLTLTLAYVHAFPQLIDERNLLLRAVIFFVVLFVPSLALAWSLKGSARLVRWCWSQLAGQPAK
jgi:heme/copper-type cytochrome/quinol oxidase subunit 3